MADKKISDFTAAAVIADADLFEIETAGGNSRKVTGANAKLSIGGLVFIERLSLAGVATATSAAISASYRHLQLRGVLRSAKAAVDNSACRFRFNADTGANYQFQRLYGQNATPTAQISQAQTFGLYLEIPAATSTAGFCATFEAEIPFYALTTFHKHGTMVSADHVNGTNTGHRVRTQGFAWANTAAISTITIDEDGGNNFATGSFVDIYGIV